MDFPLDHWMLRRMTPDSIAAANAEAFRRLTTSETVLVDVLPAGRAVRGFGANLVLTSGAPLRWEEYTGGQRSALTGGAIYEGLAADASEAEAAGITTAGVDTAIVDGVLTTASELHGAGAAADATDEDDTTK